MASTLNICGFHSEVCSKHGKSGGIVYVCWNCGGAGGFDRYEVDPLYYDQDDWEPCDICDGKGHYWVCGKCAKERA